MGVENPDVEIGFLKSTTPDTIRGDVEAGSCLGVGRGSCQYFIGHRLKFGLDAHIMAHFGEEGGCIYALRKRMRTRTSGKHLYEMKGDVGMLPVSFTVLLMALPPQ